MEKDNILLIKKIQYFKTINFLMVICNLNIIFIYIQLNIFHIWQNSKIHLEDKV